MPAIKSLKIEMKHLIIEIVSIFLIGFPVVSLAQSAGDIQPLDTGQKLPNLKLENVINWNQSFIYLSGFKRNLIILDFWSPGCASCIADFPEMEALQNKFGKKIQIILVNAQSEDSTRHFFEKRKRIKIPDLPFVTSDTILDRYFPHNAFPHLVWIDSSGVVRYIATGYDTDESNILSFLDGHPPSIKEKRDVFNFDYSKPVIAEGNGRWAGKALYYSYIMHRIPAQVGGLIKPDHIYENSASVAKLFKLAFEEGTKYNFNPRNTVILKVKDTSKYLYPKDMKNYDQWAENNSYYYELKVPVSESDKLYQFMQQDLERYFNVNAVVEKRKVLCLVLVKKGNINRLYSQGGPMDTNIYSALGDKLCYFHNYTFGAIMGKLQNLFSDSLPTPFVNGTGYHGTVDITFDKSAITNLNLLKKELGKNNLDLVKEEWLTNVLVIREKSNSY